jgi:hypothetical protein
MSFRTTVRRVRAVCLLAVCGIFAAAPVFAANGEAGRVIALTPGVFVERQGQRIPLEIKSPVLESDTIVTDATGRARILFADDGSVSLGPNTTLALREVAPEGSSASFKAHLGRGVARFLTGKIVEANPMGFAVSTPEGTAGIRGTIFVLQTGNGRTTLFVVNASRDVVLNGVSVPGAHKLTLPGGLPVPMTPADVAITQTVAAAPSSSTDNAAPEQALTAVPDASGPLAPPTALAGMPASDMTPLPSLTGYVSGTLYNAFSTFTNESAFHFTVDMSTGAISNASSSGTFTATPNLTWNYANGSGSFSGGAFSVSGFTGHVTDLSSPGITYQPTGANMTGTGGYANVGDVVSGWHVISLDGALTSQFGGLPFQAQMIGSRTR